MLLKVHGDTQKLLYHMPKAAVPYSNRQREFLRRYLARIMAHIVSISMVSDFFKTHNAQLKRGEKSYESGYVLSLHHDFSINPPLIKGTMSASMKQRTYAVEVSNH